MKLLFQITTFLLITIAYTYAQNAECKVKADVGIILDSSISLWNVYDKEKQFVKSVASSFNIGKDGTRLSVLKFSYWAALTIKFNDYYNLNDFSSAIDKIPLYGSFTRMDTALRLAQKEMFKPENGARSGAQKLIIMLTDGEQTKAPGYEDPALAVKDLRKAGIKVVVVGMGSYVKKASIMYIAGKENAFKADTFDQLIGADFVKSVKKKSCDNVTPPTDCPENNVDYNGNDVKLELNVADWKACLKKCKANQQCQAFTFVPKSKCCYLKSLKGNKTVKNGLISGRKNCPAKK